MRTDFLGLFAALNGARVPYVVDLVIDLAADATLDLVTTLTAAGYRPAVPVDPTLLANEAGRATAKTSNDCTCCRAERRSDRI